MNVAAMYVDPAEEDTHQAWVEGLAGMLGKDGAGGYVGFMGNEGEETSARPTRVAPGSGCVG